MQMVAVAIAKATWNWVRGKCEEAMREVLEAGRGVQAGEIEIPAMAAEAGKRDAAGSRERQGERRMRRGTRLQHNILIRKALYSLPAPNYQIKFL
jgi:hypothetical protein